VRKACEARLVRSKPRTKSGSAVALPEVAALEFPVADIEYAVDPSVIVDTELPKPPSFKPKRNVLVRFLSALAAPFRSGG
jgi:hypothetical protein